VANDGLTSARKDAKARLRWVFVGSNGIRAGWSVLIFVAILGAIGVAVHFGLRTKMQQPPTIVPPRFLLIREGASLAAILVTTALMGWIEGRAVWSYGLAGPRPVANFIAGWLGGLFCLSLMVAVLYAGGYLAFDGFSLRGGQALVYGLLWLLVFLFVGLNEEAFFRGYLQSTLARGIGFWPAAALLSLSFGAAHLGNGGETPAGIAGVVVFGLVFCLLLWVSGSLWLGIGFHCAWDWAQSYLYGTADSGMIMLGHLFLTHATGSVRVSGGSAGPEASLLLIPVLLAGLFIMIMVLRRVGLIMRKEAVLF
jgi:membrane protease YdiL (CAAX protease family)